MKGRKRGDILQVVVNLIFQATLLAPCRDQTASSRQELCITQNYIGASLKLRLQETSRETSQVGRWPAPSYLPRVNVYLPETRTCFQPDF
jgi:hypothetical protein